MTGDERCVGPIGLLQAAPENFGGLAAPTGVLITVGTATANAVANDAAKTRRAWKVGECNSGAPRIGVSCIDRTRARQAKPISRAGMTGHRPWLTRNMKKLADYGIDDHPPDDPER